ncbi:cryptochrome/photolyase family protein [Tengunoibacter tsumagoiensis]|uniref:Cryptochrome/photolyase family protein n=1 Tax=Tengunoibacter tsumagoiensis TaxID=2014871 RepID=A0A402A1D6_9CHLR|nr:cryptochrome/photolyase family protein [Tengunoibacter tsumagoiensis]GCE12859.1 cryptochrome/photolyase family protein [Tengunoibacter tsumagoiensis]
MTTVSVWIPGDQLLLQHPAIQIAEEQTTREQIHIILIESLERLRLFPYQRKKIVLLLSAMRHYADRLRTEGYQVDYIQAKSFVEGLQEHARRIQPQQLITMAASEYDTRYLQQKELEKLIGIPVTVVANTQFLVELYSPFANRKETRHAVMEPFYRAMRQHYGILMDGKESPSGGRWNYDELNREPLPRQLSVPPIVTFAPDSITQEVIELVNTFENGVGTTTHFEYAVTHEQAQQALNDFIECRLSRFGPYEDAMSTQGSVLYHAQISLYMNIGLLDTMEILQAAEAAYRQEQVPIQSVEGFIRQILGWREYMYWQYWQQMPDLRTANSWNAQRPMPQMFWDGQTRMNCIKHVATRVLDSGYSNHIERLMVVCNFCQLAGVKPYDVAAWFLSCYFDAYDWVVLPNVIGMGLNADNGRTTSKPYIASGKYIDRMSNYCKGCTYSPNKRTGPDACPFNFLYWNFLIENETRLRAGRSNQNVLGLRHINDQERLEIIQEARQFLQDTLQF